MLLFVSCLILPTLLCAQDQSQFWPELDTYVKLSDRSRLFFIASLSSDQDTRSRDGEFGPNFDYFMRPLARARLREKDPSKNKFLTFRIGYRYLPSFGGTSPNENRAIAEITSRFYLPLSILLSDRNRFDFRFVEGNPYSWRYRNRVTLERNFSIHHYEFTPYLRGELFYDSRYDKIAKNSITIGSIFPTSKRTELEAYYEDQRDSGTTPDTHTRGLGVVLSLYF